MAAADLSAVREALEVVLERYMDTLERLYATQAMLDQTCSSGFILMAKARYSMGVNAVSSLQYNEDDLEEAQVKVKVTTDNDIPSYTPVKFSLGKTENTAQEDTGVRKRNVDKGPNMEITKGIEELNIDAGSGESGEHGKDKKTKKSGPKDPLKWFGVLVPQPLRQSQQKFHSAVDLCCNIVTLREELFSAREEYVKLREQKQELLEAGGLDVSGEQDEDGDSSFSSLTDLSSG